MMRLEGNGHSARMVGEVLTGLPGGFTGVVDVYSSDPFAALTLRVFAGARNEFTMTAFPVADFDRKNRWPLVFPHIADGGGYATELIFLNVGPPVSAKLKILDETGLPLILGK